MWCTRWFLPLLLLPLPTASPFFLLIFLLSLTINAKPCFYCIVLLTTIFVSSCYWQPLPLDSPLSHPWADNITTFAEALNSTLTDRPKKPIPDVIRTMDRCWCDVSYNIIFEPFNVTHWEYLSVLRLRDDLEQDPSKAAVSAGNGTEFTTTIGDGNSTTSGTPLTPQLFSWRRALISYRKSIRNLVLELIPERPSASRTSTSNPPSPSGTSLPDVSSREPSQADLRLLREKYDLRPYGLGIIFDFSMTR